MFTRVERLWPNVFEIEAGFIAGPDGMLLEGLDVTVPDRAVTVIMGPGGSGKSTLLRSFTGNVLPSGWSMGGRWQHFDSGSGSIAWAPQKPHATNVHAASIAKAEVGAWPDAIASGSRVVLLDEPSPGDVRDHARLIERLRAHAVSGAAVVVTHHVAFARAVADRVYLVAGGRVRAHGSSPAFFDDPTDPLVERFLRSGNCWPRAAWPPALPSHFRWVLPDQLGGMGRPGLLGREEDDLAALAAAGIGLLVNLTDEPDSPALLRSCGIEGRHHPIPDMGVPAISSTATLCRGMEQAIARGVGVTVHCRAGLGRTGTILASMLVWLGEEPARAIDRVREANRGYLQNAAQMDFVSRFAASVH